MEEHVELESLRRRFWLFGSGHPGRTRQCRAEESRFGFEVGLTETKILTKSQSKGFNYAYRRAAAAATNNATAASTPASALNRLPSTAASPAPQGSPVVPLAAALAPPTANGVTLDSTGPSPAQTPAPPAEPAPTNGIHGTNTENLTSPKQTHKKKLSNTERRDRKEKANAAGGSEAERSSSKPTSPVPPSASPVPRSQQTHSAKNSRGTPKSNASPALSADPTLPESEGATPAVTSPLVRDAATLGGAKSPVPGQRRPKQPWHPWTLFVNKLPVPVSEDELKDVFGDHKADVRVLVSE